MNPQQQPTGRLDQADLLKLSKLNTPTLFNGWEQITRRDAARECFNREQVRDFMPHLGTMVGYAVTVVAEPSNPDHGRANPNAWAEYRRHVAAAPSPTIVVVQDLDKPEAVGSFWGEVTATFQRAVGCVGTVTDGAVRDVEEMTAVGFKAIARRLCVGHAHVVPIRWGCEVEVFGCPVRAGQLVCADRHGFLAVPTEDEEHLLDAARFMDEVEHSTVIPAARYAAGRDVERILADMERADADAGRAARQRFARRGEW